MKRRTFFKFVFVLVLSLVLRKSNLRTIELFYPPDHEKVFMRDLRLGNIFRFTDDPDKWWVASSDPYFNGSRVWAINAIRLGE